MKKIAIVPARVWDSTWGQDKDLIYILSSVYHIVVVDLVDYSFRYSSTGNTYPVPDNVTLIKRSTKLSIGLLLGIYSEFSALKHIIRVKPDIFITYSTTGILLAALVSKLMRIKVMLIYADELAELFRKKSTLIAWFTRYIATPFVAILSNRIVTTALKLKEDMDKYNKNVTYIPNGVHLKEFSSISRVAKRKHERFTVGFIGGFGDWLDFDMIIEAAITMPDIEFLMVGGGVQFEYVQSQTKMLSNFTLTGYVPHEEVAEKISQMDVCLAPFKKSRLNDRVSPIKLFEYWAYKKPVIATEVYEIKQTAAESILYANNSEELIERISLLRNDYKLYERLSEEGYRRVQNHDWSVLGQRYLEILSGLVDEN